MFNLNLITKDSCPSIVDIYGILPDLVSSLCTDSRKLTKNCIYLALAGENFDAHAFIPELLNKNVAVIVYNSKKYSEKEVESFQKEATTPLVFISCTDTELFLQELANHRINSWKKISKDNIVIGITGSNGKTTNKEMVYALLNDILPGEVLCTKGNLNNHLGVPFTLLAVGDEHQISIVEMGSNHLGEIDFLCQIAEPDCGIITNIGNAHLEFFKSMDNIFKEKSSLYDYVSTKSKNKRKFVLNCDDSYLSKIKPSVDTLCFGENHKNKIEYINDGFKIIINKEHLTIKNSSIKEKYNLLNLAQSLLLCLQIFPKQKQNLIKAANNFKLPSMNRSQWIKYEDKNIFLDAYNANPTSMKASLESFLTHIKQEKIDLRTCLFVIGDMNELGEFTQSKHFEISKYLFDSSAQNIITIGRYASFLAEHLTETNLHIYNEVSELSLNFKSLIENMTHVFIKGSRSLELEKLLSK